MQKKFISLVARAVKNSRDLKTFIDLPWQLYKNYPQWVPPLKSEMKKELTAANPYFAHAQVQHFLAYKNGAPAGRITAHINRLFIEKYQKKLGFFGFFECINDRAVAQELFAQAEQYLRAQGMEYISGPYCYDINNANVGLQIAGFKYAPPMLMPYHPPYYQQLLDACGYAKKKDLRSYTVNLDQGLAKYYEDYAARFLKPRNITVTHMDKKLLEQQGRAMLDIYIQSFSGSNYWGFVEPTTKEISALIEQLKLLILPECCTFASDHNKAIGIWIVLKDFSPLLQKLNGSLFPLGFWHLLRRKPENTTVRGLLVAILPEYQNLGLGPTLVIYSMLQAQALGYKTFEYGWVWEDNVRSWKIPLRFGGAQEKQYRIYEKEL